MSNGSSSSVLSCLWRLFEDGIGAEFFLTEQQSLDFSQAFKINSVKSLQLGLDLKQHSCVRVLLQSSQIYSGSLLLAHGHTAAGVISIEVAKPLVVREYGFCVTKCN